MKTYENEKTVVIIPAYEPPKSFVSYARELALGNCRKIIVVDDGSGQKYSDIFSQIEKIDKVTLITVPNNRGKGHALKTAFEYCKQSFDSETVFVTADCDGQHPVNDVDAVAARAALSPESLVLGVRDFSLECVPKRSRTGNLFTRRMFSLLYGLSLSDTQTGLRAFSYGLIDKLLSIKGERFEYEMNMLIVLHKKGVKIKEEKISTVYRSTTDGEEPLSHFRTVRDSMRVLSVLFKNLGWYFLSSVVSAVIEILAFFLLANTVLDANFGSVALNMLIPTVGARILSSVFNFILNFKLVFGGKSRRAIGRYYLLWSVQLGLTYGATCAFTALFERLQIGQIETAALITACKAIFDLIIAVLSYQIQSRWVFSENVRTKTRFYGPYLRFWRAIYNIFVRKYDSLVTPPESEPRIYVCRHLNTHAPIKICQCIGFDLHFFVLHNFFGFKNVYKQYSTYTFTARYGRHGIKLLLAKLASPIAALWFAPIIKSIEAIPVYRNSADSIVTYRRAMKYLERGESLILFPDVDYTAGADEKSDIYTGFLYLEKLYYRKYKKHLTFVTLKVDDEKKKIVETGRVLFGSDDFACEQKAIAEMIHSMLMI